LAEANGGSVEFESSEGSGSTFWVILPLAPMEADREELYPSEERAEVFAGRGEKVLLVDADEEARQMLERFLTHHGFTVVTAGTGREILRAVRENDIELCIVENDLPDLSGEEIVPVIRANPKLATVPLILLSARAFVFDIEHFLKLGVDRCLSKPVDLHELAHTSRRLLDESRGGLEAPVA
jgi:two-component system alkaline phosphatase synthesis response regulator PhoP